VSSQLSPAPTIGGDGAGRLPAIGESHRSLSASIAAQIRDDILSGRYVPHQRLVESELARQFGVSRVPVREALLSLEPLGLIENIPRRGARVARISAEQVEDLFAVRAALEVLAARLASRRRDRQAVLALEDVLKHGQFAASEGRLDDLPALNLRFHSLIIDAAKNEYVAYAIAPLVERIEMVYAQHVTKRASGSWAEHGVILRAIVAGDEERAGRLAAAHLENAKSAFVLAQPAHSKLRDAKTQDL
jgi:DNA-binding GntR family transcriptional regulator